MTLWAFLRKHYWVTILTSELPSWCLSWSIDCVEFTFSSINWSIMWESLRNECISTTTRFWELWYFCSTWRTVIQRDSSKDSISTSSLACWCVEKRTIFENTFKRWEIIFLYRRSCASFQNHVSRWEVSVIWMQSASYCISLIHVLVLLQVQIICVCNSFISSRFIFCIHSVDEFRYLWRLRVHRLLIKAWLMFSQCFIKICTLKFTHQRNMTWEMTSVWNKMQFAWQTTKSCSNFKSCTTKTKNLYWRTCQLTNLFRSDSINSCRFVISWISVDSKKNEGKRNEKMSTSHVECRKAASALEVLRRKDIK